MPDTELSPQIVLDEMVRNGVTDVVWLPDRGGQAVADLRAELGIGR